MHQFSSKNGLSIAAGFTEFNSETEWELDPSYGRLRFKASTWGIKDDDSVFWHDKEFDGHVCSEAELGLDS